MSWYISFNKLTIDELTNLEASDQELQNGLGREPFERSVAAICELAESGVLGDPTKIRFSGSLAGHANKDHSALPGWTQDSISLSIAQAREPSALDKAANENS